MIVDVIVAGSYSLDQPLPSCRKMAQQLKVAKNTIVAAYQQLADEGLLIARERRGYFINPQIEEYRDIGTSPHRRQVNRDPAWLSHMQMSPAAMRIVERPLNWSAYPHPFIYGQMDRDLFPISDWRECSRLALNRKLLEDWTSDLYFQDYPELVQQIKSRLLPSRGVYAADDEILVTVGSQNALYLIARMLCGPQTCIGFENPGYADAWNIFRLTSKKIRSLPVDGDGLVVDDRLDECDVVYVTPSHQLPTTVTMSVERRRRLLEMAAERNFVVIEDDYEFEFNYVKQATSALKALDRDGRVIYVGSLSKSLFPGLRIGYLVGPAAFVRQARALRGAILRHPPSNNQHTVALFLALGYYDSLIRRLHREYHERWQSMAGALDHYLPGMSRAPNFGGTSFWVEGPGNLVIDQLVVAARERGVLIESPIPCFHSEDPPHNYFRLSFSAITTNLIEPGIRLLSEELFRITE